MQSSGAVCAAVAGCLLWAPMIVAAQDGARASAQVATLVARLDSAWNSKDTVATGRLLAPRYQYFTSLGAVRARAPILEFLGSPEYAVEHARRSEIAISVSGPVAVVSSRWQGRGTYRGKRFVDDQRCGQVWLEARPTWQVVSEHCVQIVADSSASSE